MSYSLSQVLKVASQVPQMHCLCREGQQVSNGGEGMQSCELLLQLQITWILPQIGSFLILDLAHCLPGVLLLLQLVFFKHCGGAGRSDVDHIGQNHHKAEQ